MLKDDFTFSLRYDVTEETFQRFWSVNQPSKEELNYINSFNNVIVSGEDTPVISPKNSRMFSLPDEQMGDIANKLSGNMLLTDQTFILKSPTVRYFSDMKEFKPFTESFKLPDCIVKLCEE